MSREVDRVLAERVRRAGSARGMRSPEAMSVLAALALHALFVALALLLPRLTPPPEPLEFVPVQIIPAQALGVRRPAPPRPQAPPPPTPEPAVEEPAPEPEAPPEPEPEPEPVDEAPVLPDPKPDRKKEETKPKPARSAETPAPADRRKEPPKASEGRSGKASSEETGDQLGRRGGAQGNPLGTTAFGSEVAGLDNPDFTYGYYLDRLLSLIDAQWMRPSMGAGVKAVVFFRIHRDGSMTDLRIEQSSGYNSFDLAALRAVQNAAPFPPLPRAYRHDSLGVNLIVR